MGIKTTIFLTAFGTVSFITFLLISFHFAIAGALVWDGNVCPDDEFFSKCVQLHAYLAAMFLTIIVETLMASFGIVAIICLVTYYCMCLRGRNGYSSLESNADKQLGHVCSRCQAQCSVNPSASFGLPNEHTYSVAGNNGEKYNTLV